MHEVEAVLGQLRRNSAHQQRLEAAHCYHVCCYALTPVEAIEVRVEVSEGQASGSSRAAGSMYWQQPRKGEAARHGLRCMHGAIDSENFC